VVGRHQLALLLTGMPAVLSPYEVADIGRHLAATLGGPRSPQLLTTAALDTAARPRRARRERPAAVPAARGRGRARPGTDPRRRTPLLHRLLPLMFWLAVIWFMLNVGPRLMPAFASWIATSATG
jgi:hypothetical protein